MAHRGNFARIDPEEAERRAVTERGIEVVRFALPEAKRLVGRLLAEAAAGRIRPVIGQTFPLEHAANAHRAIEARDVVGKTLLLT
jgi:NADPH2:quinone reductase